MDNFRNRHRNRRYQAYVSLLGTTQIHFRNPYIVACWSMAFPGFGHLLLNKYLRGYALVTWEMYINQKIHLNLAMVLSFNGQFQAAKEALDPKFVMLYIPVYLFAIWDSYRTSVDLNKVYVLAERENAPFNTFSIGALEINYLDKRKPWLAALWSAAVPSMGQLYLHRIVLAVSVLIFTILIIDGSNFILSLHYLILGDLRRSSAVLDAQWLLYLPSMYLFNIYESYTNAVENNKLFNKDLKNFLLRNYQPKGRFFTIRSRVD
ncbi:hypothetical protein J25TS5_16460 [Paenibacillus faecis]|uniref:hypothetical protein n=1 Tax=Paenibacillus faecis TaxID=862114 RepID=UPI001B1A843F|nr:hypothetical protein [Paenibacillus faecis]GIO84714.1 hypothetical protein J25TS5_16460 [Paenibacillus faecis]